MMTEQELLALVELLNRTPMTSAERLWLQPLIQRCADVIRQRSTEEGIVK